MKIVFWTVVASSLFVSTIVGLAALGVNSKPAQDAGQNDEIDPGTLFPLAKRDGLQVQVVTTSPSPNIKRTNFVVTFRDGKKSLDKVLAHPETANGIQLIVASNTLYRSGDLPQAAFLSFAGQLRLAHDLNKYDPKGDRPGMGSTNAFASQLVDEARFRVTRDLYHQPKTFAAVVARLEGFNFEEPAGYDPGWDYTVSKVPANLAAKNKAGLLGILKAKSQLLLIPDYDKAFCDLQVLVEKVQEDNPTNTLRQSKPVEVMRRIEKEKGLRGFAYYLDQEPTD